MNPLFNKVLRPPVEDQPKFDFSFFFTLHFMAIPFIFRHLGLGPSRGLWVVGLAGAICAGFFARGVGSGVAAISAAAAYTRLS